MKIRLSQIKTIPQSIPPTLVDENDMYLDDGTNTASGVLGWRIYLGGEWEDFGMQDIDGLDVDGGSFEEE